MLWWSYVGLSHLTVTFRMGSLSVFAFSRGKYLPLLTETVCCMTNCKEIMNLMENIKNRECYLREVTEQITPIGVLRSQIWLHILKKNSSSPCTQQCQTSNTWLRKANYRPVTNTVATLRFRPTQKENRGEGNWILRLSLILVSEKGKLRCW